MTVPTLLRQTAGSPDRGLSTLADDGLSDFAAPTMRAQLDCVDAGIVMVWGDALRSRGVCSCGWIGRQHWLSALAIHDAHVHACRYRCRPAVPLVLRFTK